MSEERRGGGRWWRSAFELLQGGHGSLVDFESEVGSGLVTGCSDCREKATTLAAMVAELAASRSKLDPGIPSPPSRSRKGHSSEKQNIAAALERLRDLPGWVRRRDLVRLQHFQFRGVAVAQAFLEEARRALPAEPEEASEWAALVGLAAGFDQRHYCASSHEQAALFLRAELFVANALRCRGELDLAEAHFAAIAEEARWNRMLDLAFWADYKSFVSSLCRAQRDYPRALREAHFAALYFAQLDDRVGAARAGLTIATIHEQLGEPAAALEAARAALASAPAEADPDLWFNLRHMETSFLARCGRFAEAASSFAALAPDYDRRPWADNFRSWASGLISTGLGRAAEAESAFQAARDGFLARGNPYDAALVTLDWTLLLLEQDRPSEVLALAASMGRAFEALGVARETLASWAILQTAAERREVSRSVAETLARTLGSDRASDRQKS